MRLPVLILASVVGVQANTEATIVERKDVLNDLKELGPTLEVGKPFRGLAAPETRLVLDADPGRYFVKVCWPATEPADFDLDFEDPYLIITTKKDVFRTSNVSEDVHFTVLASDLLYGVPKDLWPTIGSIAGVAAVGSIGAWFIVSNL